jgi:predicted transposase YdaD
MAQKDIISKHTLSRLTADIATMLLGLDIDTNSVELLETEQQRVELRKADLVARVRERESGQPFILHVEIQNDNQPVMPLRMLRYFSDIQLAYPQERICQYLLYIGKSDLTMPDYFEAMDFRYCYRVLDMRTVDCELLIRQDTPDALVLAILCDFKGKPVQDVVNYVVHRMSQLLADDEKGFRNYFEMLETLGDNRDLKPYLQEARDMLTQPDVTRWASYSWGKEDGLKEGLLKGEQQGEQKGELKGELKAKLFIARNLLDAMTDGQISKVTDLPVEEIQALRIGRDAADSSPDVH